MFADEFSRTVPDEIVGAMPRLVPLARRWARNEGEALDLIQDTVERALSRAASYRAGTNVGAWLRSIMHHLAIDHTRRQRRDGLLREGYRHVEQNRQAPAPDEAEAPAALAFASIEDVRRAAQRLREPLRGTFLLWLEERLSYKEISRRLRIPPNTVATRLLRARRQVCRLATEGGATALAA
jgi:RNA polymerase sigma-70 factor, ECF subfamily